MILWVDLDFVNHRLQVLREIRILTWLASRGSFRSVHACFPLVSKPQIGVSAGTVGTSASSLFHFPEGDRHLAIGIWFYHT